MRPTPAEADLPRARVVRDVVAGRACRTREPSARRSPARNACGRPFPPGARRRSRGGPRASSSSPPGPRGAARARRVPSPSSTTKISSSALWQCGGLIELAGRDLEVPEPGLARPGGSAEVARRARDGRPVARLRLDVVDVDDAATAAPPSSPTSGGPALASRFHGWSSGAPSSTHVGPSQETPARGSNVLAA